MSQSELVKAPFNQSVLPPKIVSVVVTVTLSKKVNITVDDYSINSAGMDEDGNYYEDIDYSNCDFKEAVEKQITMPQDAYYELNKAVCLTDNIIAGEKLNDLKGWQVDNLEVESEV
ncbi:MAG: hypothetical protein ACI398_04060 [Clostridium sp.]